MQSVPVIVSSGGVNASGRTAFNFGYQRLVYQALERSLQLETLLSIATLTNRLIADGNGGYVAQDLAVSDVDQWLAQHEDELLNATLVRELEANHFDYKQVPYTKSIDGELANKTVFTLAKRKLPVQIPASWSLIDLDEKTVEVTINEHIQFDITDYKQLPVSSAGQLPTGFDPASQYPSRHHPRGLQLTVYGAGEALANMGVDWSLVEQAINPDQLAVYASSAMSQLDEAGGGGLMTARLQGKRVSSKQCPLSLMQMPADFINAYMVGGLGATGAMVGACATFLYDLQVAVDAIKRGEKRIAIVGNAEAPLNPSVFEGYAAMSALATDEQLAKLDGAEGPDQRRASRPFGDNTGFTLAEGAQFVVICDDALALELGLPIKAAVTDIFVNADGYKKSISAPGVGNYITMAKAVAAANSLYGNEVVQQRSFVQAHGSSTPQNRVTESHIFSEVAKANGITNWPVTAVKSYLGHTLGVASGDQMAATLGAFEHGVIPRINNTAAIADDVYTEGLSFVLEHQPIASGKQVAFLNAKGFGGNNASAVVANDVAALELIEQLRGTAAIEAWRDKLVVTEQVLTDTKQAMLSGQWRPEYRFDYNVLQPNDVRLTDDSITLGAHRSIPLNS